MAEQQPAQEENPNVQQLFETILAKINTMEQKQNQKFEKLEEEMKQIKEKMV